MRSPDRLAAAALLGASLFVLGWNLGGEGPDRRGERIALDIARTMRETGDWITPRFLGEPYFKKPPLHYWCIAASSALGGVSVEAARRPVVLFSLAGLLLAWAWARDIGGSRAGTLAAAVALGNASYFLYGRTAMMDVPLAVLVAASTRWLGRGAMLRGWAAAGLGFLAKGPLGVLLPVGAVAIERLSSRRGRELARLFAPAGLLVFLVVAAPWPIAMAARHGAEFVRTFFVGEGLLAFASDEGHRTTPAWPYVPFLLASFTVFAPALFGAARAAWRSPSPDLRAALALAGETLLVFLLASRKADRYFLPSVLPLAVLAGVHLAKAPEGMPVRSLRAGLWILALLVPAAPAAVAWATPGTGAAPALAVTLPLLGGLVAGTLASRAGRPFAASLALAGSIVGVEAVGVDGVFEAVAHDPIPRVEAALAEAGLSRAPLAVDTGILEERLRVDLRREVELVDSVAKAEDWLGRPGPRAAILSRSTWDALPSDVRAHAPVLLADWGLPRVSWRWLVERGLAGALRDRKVEIVLAGRTEDPRAH